MKIQTRIESLMEKTRALQLKNPNQGQFQIVLTNLELLHQEFSLRDSNKDKINQIHYGLIRVLQELGDYEKTPFGKEADELMVDLKKY